MNPKYKQGSGLAAAAIMAAIMGAGGGVVTASAEATQAFSRLNAQFREGREKMAAFTRALPASVAAKRALWLSMRRTRLAYIRGGWSVRQGQRMARKARNVRANRSAHRG